MTPRWAALALASLAALTHCGFAHGRPNHGAADIQLDTAGGDTWRFARTITGKISRPGACKRVTVAFPGGEAVATLDGDRFAAEIRLHSGPNTVQATCRRSGGGRSESRDSGGHRFSGSVVKSAPQVWTVREEDRPHAWVRTVVVGGMVRLDAGATRPAAGIPVPLSTFEWRPDPHNPAPVILANGRQVEFRPPTVDGAYRITLHVTDALGRSDESTTLFRVANGRPEEVNIENAPPAWLDRAVVYGAAPTLLTPYGFAGVTQRLSAIAALGANLLWLTPVTAAPPGDFGYAVTDHFHVRDAFGADAELRSLIDSAHARGLKVLLDFVTNHLSNAHPYYRDAERRGIESPYYTWFERDAQGKVVHYFDWTQLENLDYDNPDVRAYITAACSYWVRVYHVDGFRMDAAWAVRERAPEIWPLLRRELRRIDPEVVLLAEASALDPYYRTHGFDAAYDWTEQLGEWAWQRAYGDSGSPPNLPVLRSALDKAALAAPAGSGFLVFRFLDNNDTGVRFLDRHGIGATRAATALLFTLPGLPSIFDGEEVGASFEPYRGGPPIVWRDPHHLEPLFARLVKLRHEIPVLRSGSLTLLSTDHDDSVLAFARDESSPNARSGDQAIVVINFGTVPVEVRLEPSSANSLANVLAGKVWVEESLLTQTRSELAPSTSTLPLAPQEALLLRPALHAHATPAQ